VSVAGFRAACHQSISAGQGSLSAVDPPLPHRGAWLSFRARQDMGVEMLTVARAGVLRVPSTLKVDLTRPGSVYRGRPPHLWLGKRGQVTAERLPSGLQCSAAAV